MYMGFIYVCLLLIWTIQEDDQVSLQEAFS